MLLSRESYRHVACSQLDDTVSKASVYRQLGLHVALFRGHAPTHRDSAEKGVVAAITLNHDRRGFTGVLTALAVRVTQACKPPRPYVSLPAETYVSLPDVS